MNIHEQMIERIDAVLDSGTQMHRYGLDDEAVLTYVRAKLTPEAMQERAENEFDSGSVIHLMEVAKSRLRPYEEARSGG